MSTWYYMKDGARMGPVTTEELTALLTSGSVRRDTLVWRDGLASWVAISTLPDFASAVPAAAAATPGAAGAGIPPPPSSTGGPGVEIPDPADVDKNKVFGVLSYLGLLCIVPLLAARQSKFAMYHCNQGIVLMIAAFAACIGIMIVNFVLAFIPFIGWLLALLLWLGLWVGSLVLAIMGIINAAKGECKPLPVIGNRFTLVK